MSICLGDYIDKESIFNEFKEFRFNDNMINYILADTNFNIKNISVLMKMSTYCLKYYIEKYLHKYLTSFINTEIEYGTLHLGISDFGEIIGIPIIHELSENNYEIIRKMITDTFTHMHFGCSDLENEIKNKMEIIITNIDTTNIDGFGCDIDSYLIARQGDLEKYLVEHTAFHNHRKQINNRLAFYKRAINEMINETEIRCQLKNHIQMYGTNISEADRTCLIDRLNNPELILFNKGDIQREKLISNTLGYWIAKYRDDMSTMLLKYKPSRPLIQRPLNPYYMLMRDFKPLVPHFIKNGIQMILIQIKIPGKLSLIHYKSVHFKNGCKTTHLIRTIDKHGNPCSMSSDPILMD